jgi:hypothetical protein
VATLFRRMASATLLVLASGPFGAACGSNGPSLSTSVQPVSLTNIACGGTCTPSVNWSVTNHGLTITAFCEIFLFHAGHQAGASRSYSVVAPGGQTVSFGAYVDVPAALQGDSLTGEASCSGG